MESEITMQLQTVSGTSNLSNIIIAVGYGHMVIGVSASLINISGISVGINFQRNQ